MTNVIFKTALKTIVAVIIALVLIFGIVSVAYPQGMASICESCGNYRMATGYASLRYSYSGDYEDLARCMEDSLKSEYDKDIIKYGEKLVRDGAKFNALCAKVDEEYPQQNYRQYIYGEIVSAKYRRGDKQSAIDFAKDALYGLEDFPVNNAVAILAIRASDDGETKAQLLAFLTEKYGDLNDEYYQLVIYTLTLNNTGD